MEIKAPRQYVLEDYPTKYLLAFDVSQWNHGEGVNDICNTSEAPYRMSFLGFLLTQHGVSPKRLCVAANEPGVVFENHRYPVRYFSRFPKELAWWGDRIENPDDLLAYLAGDMSIDQYPEVDTVPGMTYHQLLARINDATWGLTKGGKRAKLSLSWRAFWLREVTRVGSGIGIQFHEPRGKAN